MRSMAWPPAGTSQERVAQVRASLLADLPMARALLAWDGTTLVGSTRSRSARGVLGQLAFWQYNGSAHRLGWPVRPTQAGDLGQTSTMTTTRLLAVRVICRRRHTGLHHYDGEFLHVMELIQQ